MPKTEIDYSNTIIYKITCIDTSINHVYVGHTTNFVQRKHAHKQGCANEKSSNYNCKLYKTIRANGGWNNWIMEIVAFFKCNDHYEARIKEQEYFTSLNATLNSIEPLPKPKPKPKPTDTQITEPVLNTKKYCCETCNVTLQNQHLLDVHNNTKKHCKKILGIETTVKNGSEKFSCDLCHFSCSKSSNYDKHLLTRKHKNTAKTLPSTYAKNADISIESNIFMCGCGKDYKHRQSLYNHRKMCPVINNLETTVEPTVESTVENPVNEQVICENLQIFDLVKYLMKENSELKNMMMEQKNLVLNIAKNIMVEK